MHLHKDYTFPNIFCDANSRFKMKWELGVLDNSQIMSQQNSLFHDHSYLTHECFGKELIYSDRDWLSIIFLTIRCYRPNNKCTQPLTSFTNCIWQQEWDEISRDSLISPCCFIHICLKVSGIKKKKIGTYCFIAGTIIIHNLNPWWPPKQYVLF